ncbi:MAG: hypothetical protein AB1478_11280 [Nitrospirota bacterium]
MKEALSIWVDAALHAERDRVACQVRLSHLAKQNIKCHDTETLFKKVWEHEKWLDNRIAEMIKTHPTYPWFSRIKGCGPENMPKVIGLIESFGKYYDVDDPEIPDPVKVIPVLRTIQKDGKPVEVKQVFVRAIERFTMPSKLRKFAGLYPGAKRQAGKRLEFNIELRTMLYRLLISFMRAQNRYYEFYLKYKDWLIKKRAKEGLQIVSTPKGKYCPNCKEEKGVKSAKYCKECGAILTRKKESEGILFLGHLDAMCKRKMIQLFCDHLWSVWRKAEGLSVTKPYVIEILDHTDYIDPWKMCDRKEK